MIQQLAKFGVITLICLGSGYLLHYLSWAMTERSMYQDIGSAEISTGLIVAWSAFYLVLLMVFMPEKIIKESERS